MVLTSDNKLIGIIEGKTYRELVDDIKKLQDMEFVQNHPVLSKYMFSLVYFKPIDDKENNQGKENDNGD